MRRAKLYYLRGLTGKKARIVEKIVRKTGVDLASPSSKSQAMPEEPQGEQSAPQE